MAEKKDNDSGLTWIVVAAIVLAFLGQNPGAIDRIKDEVYSFFSGEEVIPKDWVRQKSPVSKSTIACPESWPHGTNGLMGAIWVSNPYPDDFNYVALRKFRQDKPLINYSSATEDTFMQEAIPEWKILLGLNITNLGHDFEMDGEEAIWGAYRGFTVKRNRFFGFSAITWKDGYLYMLQAESENPFKQNQLNTLLMVAELADLK